MYGIGNKYNCFALIIQQHKKFYGMMYNMETPVNKFERERYYLLGYPFE